MSKIVAIVTKKITCRNNEDVQICGNEREEATMRKQRKKAYLQTILLTVSIALRHTFVTCHCSRRGGEKGPPVR
jgi:hypothetical protein